MPSTGVEIRLQLKFANCIHGEFPALLNNLQESNIMNYRVPKELIARFVRNCPSCALRRSSPLEYPMVSVPTKNQQHFEVLVGNTTYTTSSASTLNPILRTSNDAMGALAGPTLGMSSASIPQLQAMANGSGLLSPSANQDVSVGSYQYTNSFATSLSEGANGMTAVSPLSPVSMDPRQVFRGPQ